MFISAPTTMPRARLRCSSWRGFWPAAARTERGILFVAYGAEETGAVGSHYFATHPPVPLDQIVANIEFEMIGSGDPKLASGMMLTGFERSDLGELLRSKGALLSPDPYPEQRFFERSDNYELALEGVVAHTVSGWPTTPIYHQVSDTNANIDFAFMAPSDPVAGRANPLARQQRRAPSMEPGRPPRQAAALARACRKALEYLFRLLAAVDLVDDVARNRGIGSAVRIEGQGGERLAGRGELAVPDPNHRAVHAH